MYKTNVDAYKPEGFVQWNWPYITVTHSIMELGCQGLVYIHAYVYCMALVESPIVRLEALLFCHDTRLLHALRKMFTQLENVSI